MAKLVSKFNLNAAFKALDDIEIPEVNGIRPQQELQEHYTRKLTSDVLIEDYYNINDSADMQQAAEDRDAEVAQAKLERIEKIVDLDADSPEDLLPSYAGKIIIQCPQCMEKFYKDEADIEYSEENPDVVNVNETCQHCGNNSGYTVIGKVAPVEDSEMADYTGEEAPAEDTAEENAEEAPAEESSEGDLDLDLDFGEPTEESDAEGSGEDLDLDLDLDLGEEEEEEKTEESFRYPMGSALLEAFDELDECGELEEALSAEQLDSFKADPFFEGLDDRTITKVVGICVKTMAEDGMKANEKKLTAEDVKSYIEDLGGWGGFLLEGWLLEAGGPTRDLVDAVVGKDAAFVEALKEFGVKSHLIEPRDYKTAYEAAQHLTPVQLGEIVMDTDNDMEDFTLSNLFGDAEDDPHSVEGIYHRICKGARESIEEGKTCVGKCDDPECECNKDALEEGLFDMPAVKRVLAFATFDGTKPDQITANNAEAYADYCKMKGIKADVNADIAKFLKVKANDKAAFDKAVAKYYDSVNEPDLPYDPANESVNLSKEAPTEHDTENHAEEAKSLNESAEDKDLDKKLKEHNEYIEFLRNQISQEEEALKNAKNEFVKSAIERRLDTLKADLEAALPDEVKNEAPVEDVAADEIAAEEPVADEVPAEAEDAAIEADVDAVEEAPAEEDIDANESYEPTKLKEAIEIKVTVNEIPDEAADIATAASEPVSEPLTIGEPEIVGVEPCVGPECAAVAPVEDVAPVDDVAAVASVLAAAAEDNAEDGEVEAEIEAEANAEEAEAEAEEAEKEVEETEEKAEEDAKEDEEKEEDEDEEDIDESLMNKNAEEYVDHLGSENRTINEEAEDVQAADVKDSEVEELFDDIEGEGEISKAEVKSEIEDLKKEESVNFDELEDIDESKCNKLITESLTKVYENVESFETTGCSINKGHLVLEGNINFKSGTVKPTSYTFIEAMKKGDRCRLTGINEGLSNDGAFILEGSMKDNAIKPTSFKYSYKIQESLVEGIVEDDVETSNGLRP